ncbi:hypothetical protein BC830DRAFT_1168005 [Chytriomyces sp. MP71]|nr:hypothetical protein BC830DRAFT_1168005 [Chytriomyces sp. MP71]
MVLQDVPGDNLLKEWGVSVKPEMELIDARVLRGPLLTGGLNMTASPLNGAYDLTRAGNVKYFKPASLDFWPIAVFGDPYKIPYNSVVDFMGRLFFECHNHGMEIFRYRMSFLFARATRSVGAIPAIYYARLLAYRPGGAGGLT